MAPGPKEKPLLQTYRAAMRAYIEAATSLEGLNGPQFEAAFRRAEKARETFERLREELLKEQPDSETE